MQHFNCVEIIRILFHFVRSGWGSNFQKIFQKGIKIFWLQHLSQQARRILLITGHRSRGTEIAF